MAALAVLIAHIAVIIAQPRFFGRLPGSGVLEKFGAGVDFFFVLSGFIIAWVHWDDIGRPAEVGSYALRRFRRIFPPYWGVLLPLSLAYFLFPSAGDPSQHDFGNFVASFLLLPYPEHPILGVAWTLVYEIIFYTLFALLILFGRGMFWLLALWGLAVLVVNLTFDRLTYPFSILLDVRNLQFLMGILAALWVRRVRVPAPRAVALIGTGLFLAQLLVFHPVLDDPLVGRLGFGMAAVLAIVGVVGWERDGRLSVTAPLRLLGAASYSIYLVHGIAISAAIHIVSWLFPRDVPLLLPLIALVVSGVVAGIGYHLIVERPLLRWVGRWRWARKVASSKPKGVDLVG